MRRSRAGIRQHGKFAARRRFSAPPRWAPT
jgi:hypothetical protein